MVGLKRNERGAVYVEFLLAFPPLFVLFLAICQTALMSSARIVVQHAANAAARSAIVVLEDDPSRYGGAARGSLSDGRIEDNVSGKLLERFGMNVQAPAASNTGSQQGARMVPIRLAAYRPLAILAPRLIFDENQRGDSIAAALTANFRATLINGLILYNRAAAIVTIQAAAGSTELISEPVTRGANVTVRVTYLYNCTIPIVRRLMCKTLDDLRGRTREELFGPFARLGQPDPRTDEQRQFSDRLRHAENPEFLAALASSNATYAVISAEATLPNQGAAYY